MYKKLIDILWQLIDMFLLPRKSQCNFQTQHNFKKHSTISKLSIANLNQYNSPAVTVLKVSHLRLHLPILEKKNPRS